MEENKVVENEAQTTQAVHDEYEKEGYAHLIVDKNDKKLILYIDKEMPLNVAFDASFDIAIHLRELYKKRIDEAIEKQKKDKDSGDVSAE